MSSEKVGVRSNVDENFVRIRTKLLQSVTQPDHQNHHVPMHATRYNKPVARIDSDHRSGIRQHKQN